MEHGAEIENHLGHIEVDEKTEFEMQYDAGMDIVRVIARGELYNGMWLEIVKKAEKLASDYLCERIFCNYTGMRLAETVSGIYDCPPIAPESGIPKTLKVAVLYSMDEENHKFWENRCQISGFNVGIFKTESDAMAWLTDQTGS